MIEHRWMTYRRAWVLVGLGMVGMFGGLGCTKPNPRSCKDGTCTDPGFPFCDTDGALAGEPQTCLAVACTPGEFAGCRGDTAITCNTAGADYDLIQCERGCDEAAGGCHLCDPNQTACTNGKVATCDASGAIVSAETCALGCFEDQPRCRELVPSNNLGLYFEMVDSPPDLDLMSASFDTATGRVFAGPTEILVPNFLTSPSGNGVPIRVFVVGSLKLQSGTISHGGDPRDPAGPAFALVARGDIEVTGEILVEPRAGGASLGCLPPGSGTAMDQGSGRTVSSGGGGGGNATDGARGGGVINSYAGGVKGGSSGTPGLVPLRGGCGGGFVGYAPATPTGGGAVQFSSRTSLVVDATIDVRGTQFGDRLDQTNGFIIGGGGAGGGILLEAPTVTLGAEAKLLASGGDGATACTTPNTYCGASGRGDMPGIPATAGGDADYTNAANITITGGGGGGGLGRVRINTATGNYQKASSVVEAALVTTGTISTR